MEIDSGHEGGGSGNSTPPWRPPPRPVFSQRHGKSSRGGRRDGETEAASVEKFFDGEKVPSWHRQLTVRAFLVSLVLGFFLCFIVMKLTLTIGIVPSLNVSAGLLGFFLVTLYSKCMEKLGFAPRPFTRQENAVVQTCIVACSSIAFSGGFGSYILGMTEQFADPQSEGTINPVNVKTISLPWLITFMFAVSFVGLFSIVYLRKIMIIDYKLTYPSGTVTAHLINSFHTPQGARIAKRQVSVLFKSFVASFFWSCFQWFYTAGSDCGFVNFPSLGLEAYRNSFFFDFSATYVGIGMICPGIVNASLLLGAIVSWGILYPCVETKRGDWYPADLSPGSLRGLKGYKTFIPIAMILGDGLCNFFIIIIRAGHDIYRKCKKKDDVAVIPVTAPGEGAEHAASAAAVSYDEEKRNAAFLKDQIPLWIPHTGYIILALVSTLAVPTIFPQVKFYHVVVTYVVAPVLAFCNSYGCGLTDWSLASSYGKLAIFGFAAWTGVSNGGIVAGLAVCGVMMSIVGSASDLMQDLKTGYLTLASPRAMFISQVVGTAMGCLVAPCVFWIFYKAFPIGAKGSPYPAPYAALYRGIAVVGVQGFSTLPRHCLEFCAGAFCVAFALTALREWAKHKNYSVHKYVPYAMGMAVPFFIGANYTIDMCIGSFLLYLWGKVRKHQADAFAPAVASGMICGDGIWSLPASLLSISNVKPPICMMFLSRADYNRVTVVLAG